MTVRHDFVTSIHGKLNVVATETHSLKAKELTISAEESLTIKVGSVSVQLKKDGDAVLKASKVNISAKSKVVIKGAKIEKN